MTTKTITPGEVYQTHGIICLVTAVDDQATVLFDDGSTDKLPLHQLADAVPMGELTDHLTATLDALKAILHDQDPAPLYNDDTMQKAHRTGMLLGALSTCDDLYARLLQAGKGKNPSFADAVRIVEQYIAGVQHMGVRDGIAETTKPVEIPLDGGN